MARPAGYSSDEFSEDEGLTFGDPPPSRRKNQVPNFDNEKVVDPFPVIIHQGLIDAAIDRNCELVSELLKQGAFVDYVSPRTKWTALMHACSLGHNDVAQILLDNKANPHMHIEHFTPLMALCDSTCKIENRLLSCLDCLLFQKVDIDKRDYYRSNCLTYAVKRGHQKLVLRLISVGIKIDNMDSDGWTPLFYAVDAGNMGMVQILKDSGANLNAIDKRGRTLYDIAIMKDFKEIAEVVCTKDRLTCVEEIIEKMRQRELKNNYNYVLSELPNKKKGRFHGFPSDVIKIIHGIGLESLSNLFLKKNVQLGEFLTFTDEQWKETGVMISFDREKLKFSARKFHERHWGKLSLGPSMNKEELSLFNVAQVTSTIVRQLFVLSTTTYYWNLHSDESQNSLAVKKYMIKGLSHIDMIYKEIDALMVLIKQIDREQNIKPADLIKPKVNNRYRRLLLFGMIVTGIVIFGYKRLPLSAIRRKYFF